MPGGPGELVTYKWSSTSSGSGTTYNSTFSRPGDHYCASVPTTTWISSIGASGSTSANVISNQIGCTYYMNYTVTDSVGQKASDNIKLYICGQYGYKSATSGFSLSSTGAVSPNLTVNVGQTFYMDIDYGDSTLVSVWLDGPPAGLSCPTQVAANGTAIVFKCSASTAGTYTLNGGTHAGYSDRTCNDSHQIGSTLTVTNIVPSGGTVTTDNSTCGKMVISWSGFTNSPTSYNLYRYQGSSLPGDLTDPKTDSRVTKITGVTSPYTDSAAAGSYFYWVTGVNGAGEGSIAPSLAASTASAITACAQGNLTGSSKTIEAINGVNTSSHSYCNGTNALPSGTVLSLGDKVSFSINLCNTTGTGDAKNMVVTDTMTNLNFASSSPVQYNGSSLTKAADCSTPGANQYSFCGSLPTETLTVNLGSNVVPAGGTRRITFDAYLAIPSGFVGNYPRFQNAFSVNYNNSITNTSASNQTPLYLFYIGKAPPSIIEVP